MDEQKDYEQVKHNNLWHLRKALQLLEATGHEQEYVAYMNTKFGWLRKLGDDE